MSLAGMTLAWAREIPASCVLAGEVGGPSVLRVELLGEALEVHQHGGSAVVQRRDWPAQDPTARILARGSVTPRQLRRALTSLGYG